MSVSTYSGPLGGLDHIKESTCPTCGAPVEDVRKFARHCNGHWNESVTYRCGRQLSFSPNGMVLVEIKECPSSEEMLKRRAAGVEWLKKVRGVARQCPDSVDITLRCIVLDWLDAQISLLSRGR